MGNKTTFNFPEEQRPCGSSNFVFLTPMYADILRVPRDGTVVQQVATHPWFIVIWEPLTSKAPNPNLTQPYCCYIRSVYFYLRPYVTRENSSLYFNRTKQCWQKSSQGFEYWEKLEYTFTHDDLIRYNAETFKVSGGTVVWKNKRWWMRQVARRQKI